MVGRFIRRPPEEPGKLSFRSDQVSDLHDGLRFRALLDTDLSKTKVRMKEKRANMIRLLVIVVALVCLYVVADVIYSSMFVSLR